MDVLAIDVGGTAIKAARIEHDGRTAADLVVPTPPAGGADVVTEIVRIIGALRGSATHATGIVVPGVVSDGIAHFAANLGWREVPVRDRLASATGLPTVVGHDVTAAALAECAGTDGLFVAVGTGIASAEVVDGAVSHGATGRAGELGHVPVWPDGEACRCGQRGCLETYASAAAVARRYAARTGNPVPTPHIIGRLDTDPDAAAVWADAVDALAIAFAHEVLVRDPAVIVLGGGLAGAGDALVAPLRVALAGRLAWRDAPEVRTARLGALAGRAGAATLAWQLVAAQREGRKV